MSGASASPMTSDARPKSLASLFGMPSGLSLSFSIRPCIVFRTFSTLSVSPPKSSPLPNRNVPRSVTEFSRRVSRSTPRSFASSSLIASIICMFSPSAVSLRQAPESVVADSSAAIPS